MKTDLISDLHIAAEAFYKAGYITKEEFEDLAKYCGTRRNECTYLSMYRVDSLNINLGCYEIIEPNNELLFTISYNGYYDSVTRIR